MNPEAVDLLINPRWIIPVIPENATFSDCSVAVRDGRIVAICPRKEAGRRFRAAEIIDLDNHALIPGLINCHGHSAMALFRGYADDLELNTWLTRHIWPAEGRWVSEEFVRDGAALALLEMVKSGTTTFADMYFFPDQVAKKSLEFGLRAEIAFPIFDFPTAWARNGDEYIHKGLELHDAFKGNELIAIAFGPHAPYTVSDRLFEQVAIYADELDSAVHLHLHESWSEVEEALARNNQKPIDRMKSLGILTANTQCAHMVAVDDDDIALIADSRTHVVHCPRSNMKLGNGISPVTKMMSQGVNVALGTDGAASNNGLDLFSEMQFASLLAKGTTGDPTALDAHQSLRMATLNGARALGLEAVTGSIEPGKSADLVAVDLSGGQFEPLYHPASQLVYTQAATAVRDVWVKGKQLLRNGKLTRFEEEDILAKARYWHNKVSQSSDN